MYRKPKQLIDVALNSTKAALQSAGIQGKTAGVATHCLYELALLLIYRDN